LAVTDHNNVKGSLEALKAARRYKGFKIITGSEIKTNDGEVIGLGIKENVPMLSSLEEAIEKIHDLGGIAVAPHPYGKYFFRKCIEDKAKKADAIEVFNATLTKAANNKALLLSEKYKRGKTAGSDAHSINEVGNAGIICNDPLEDIVKRRTRIFGRKTPFADIAYLISRKFVRSVEWRLSGAKKNYI
jgi:predicted metal-dependent phosphoesterase TrpH